MEQGFPWLNSNKDVDNDLVMDVSELSICMDNLTHDVCKSTKILEQQSPPLGGYSESVLLANFRLRFEQLSQGANAKERVLIEARSNRLIQLYKQLKDIEPNEAKRCQYMTLFYELFDSDRLKLKSSKKLEVSNSLQVQSLRESFKTDSRKLQTRAIFTIASPRFDCFKESTCSITNNKNNQMKIEDYKRMEECLCQKGLSEIDSLQKIEKSDLQNSKDFHIYKPQAIDKRLIELKDTDDGKVPVHTYANLSDSLNIPANDIDVLSKKTGKYTISSDDPDIGVDKYILNYDLVKKKSIGKYTLKNDGLGDLSHRTPISFHTCNHNSSVNSNNSFLDEEYDTEIEDVQYLENQKANSEIIKAPRQQFETNLLIKEPSPVVENEKSKQEMHSSQTVSNIKTTFLKKINQSLSVLSVKSQPEPKFPEEIVKDVKIPLENHPDNFEHGKLIKEVSHSVASLPKKVHWEHQNHIIIAPRVVVQLFKSNPAYKSVQAPNFYEQVNQLFEIIGLSNPSHQLPFRARSIQLRLVNILQQIKRGLPRNISYSEWVAEVGKYQLNLLLSPEEMSAYESLCHQLRDDEGTSNQYPMSKDSRFRDALSGMLGQESPHLKASSVTGRLRIRSPHHQESVGESYLLLTLGLLGYLYRSLKDQLKRLEQRGDTGLHLARALRKTLKTFRDFLDRRKNQPCSVICLYWQTRKYQLLLQWLLEVLTKINRDRSQAIIVSLYAESGQRTGEHYRLLQMWLSEASKPLVSRLACWLSSGQLTASDNDEFIIERSLILAPEDFWQQSYRLAAPFSKLFNSQLAETMISVGKTVAYSKKYLNRNVETQLNSTELNSKLLHLLTHFYLHGDQEPLFDFLQKLHSDVSGKVLRFLRNMNIPPEDLFYQMHKYLMITDMYFYRELMQELEGLLREPASAFNIKLFNIMLQHLLPSQSADIYVDRSSGQGSKCWSCFLLRLRLPDYWRALLGEDIKEYEAIYPGLWKFHYANYVLTEMIARRDLHFKERTKVKLFDCIYQVDQLLDVLFSLILDAMSVLKNYLLTDLLEPAYFKLKRGCEKAKSLDDMLSANRTYLRTIRLGCFQTKGLRRCNMYLEQLYDGIMDLDFYEQKFYRILENFKDYFIKYGGQTCERSLFLIPSCELTDGMRELRWTCQNSMDALMKLREQFYMAMVDLLYSLHWEDRESFRELAQKLDRNGYYEQMDQRLQLVQRFEFKRKRQRRAL